MFVYVQEILAYRVAIYTVWCTKNLLLWLFLTILYNNKIHFVDNADLADVTASACEEDTNPNFFGQSLVILITQ